MSLFFLTSALDGDAWSVLLPRTFYSSYSLNRVWVDASVGLEDWEKERIVLYSASN